MHTTGIDIKQRLDGVAAVTIGKDMTLRDFAQGCWRMRGLGKGQSVHVLLVPAVTKLIREVSTSDDASPVQGLHVELLAWLTANSMHSERLQYAQLQKQLLADVWRGVNFGRLIASSAAEVRCRC